MSNGGIAAIGECMLELSGSGGDEWRMGFAGDTLNTLWALKALSGTGRDYNYVTAFGDDPFSRKQIAFLEENGIGTAASPVIAGARPGLYAITLQGAERSFTYWRADSAARQLASNPTALTKSLKNQSLVYFSGITLAILEAADREALMAAMATAKSDGATLAFDANYRARLWKSADVARSVINDALSITDVALPTFPDEEVLFGDGSPQATAERIARAGVGEIVVKNGEHDAIVFSDRKMTAIPAEFVASPVDTTGAGDSFNGSYLAARLEGHSPTESVRKAHRVAAAVVQVRGALAPFEVLRNAFRM